MKRRLVVLTAAALMATAGMNKAAAAALALDSGSKFAVLSLIGYSINVVTYQPTVGSKMDRNIQQTAAVAEAPFDITALRTIQSSLKEASGPGEVLLYRSPSIELFGDPRALFEDSKLLLPADFIAAMKKDGATHLLLLTRSRQDAKLTLERASIGSGRLEGIGFYVDRQTRVYNTETLQTSIGVLAPYAYLQLSLVDLATAKVLQQQLISSSHTISSTNQEDGFDPWRAMSTEVKVSTLDQMIERELRQALPALIAPK